MSRLIICIFLSLTLSAAADTKYMAITIDDLPANTLPKSDQVWQQINEDILKSLTAYRVKSVGFVNENKLYTGSELNQQRIQMLRLWLQHDQELGNHGFQHLDLHRVEVAEFIRDIERGDTVLKKLWEEQDTPKYYRHPYLHTGRSESDKKAVATFLQSKNYRIAPVTIDNQEYIFARAYEKASPSMRIEIHKDYVSYMLSMVDYYEEQALSIVGRPIPQVLLLHANQLNANSLADLLKEISGRGYQFVTLENAMQDPAYQQEDKYYGPAGITWLHRWAIAKKLPKSVFGDEPPVPAYVNEIYQQ